MEHSCVFILGELRKQWSVNVRNLYKRMITGVQGHLMHCSPVDLVRLLC